MAAADVQQQLQMLRQLQDLDSEARRVGKERRQLEQELAGNAAEVERVLAQVAALDEALAALRTEQKEMTQAITQEEDILKRGESRLPAIKTQKEYFAVLKEIDTAKKALRDIREAQERKNAEIAALEEERQQKQAELEQQQQQAAERRGAIEQRLSGVDEVLSRHVADRGEIIAQLPTVLGRRYQMVADRRGGVAVVAVRQGACLGCNMQLAPQLFNQLCRGEEVLSCPHCNRLIFMETAREA